MHPLRLVPLAFVATLSVAAENLVQNGDFSVGVTAWSLRLSPDASASLVNSEGEASVLVVNGGASRWTVNLEQALATPLRQGASYLVSFDVRAETPKRIDVLLRDLSGKILGSRYGIPVSPERTRETFAYVHETPDAAVRLVFRLGGESTAYAIDNVVVEPAPSPVTTP